MRRVMKASAYATASVLLAALVVGSESVPPQVAGPGARLAWNHDGLDESGAPETLASFEIAEVTSGTFVTVPACASSGAMTCEQALSALNLSPGVHSIHVRAVDAAGNRSAWSEAIAVDLDAGPPAKPSGCRLTGR